MFRSLRIKLTVLYAALFAAIFLLVSLAVYAAVSENAQKIVSQDLSTSASVFDRVWTLRTAQLENGAGLLSRDFGFREAIATHDGATIGSALNNLRARLDMDLALVVGVDGQVEASQGASLTRLDPAVLASVEGDDGVSGVLMLSGTPYEVVSVPVEAPTLMGWVVFATRLDRAQLNSLEKMAAVPLSASILRRTSDGRWRAVDGTTSEADADHQSAFVAGSLAARRTAPSRLAVSTGPALALVKPLKSIDARAPVVLLLQYPMHLAMAPYRPLMGLLAALAALGLAAVVGGAWILARGVTRPIAALEAAANRMRSGELAKVEASGRDEVGRLADSFNAMVAEIGQRDAERARVAETLRVARDQAEAANRAKSAFLANMSHEVRTPLNGVLGIAGVLGRSRLDTGQREMVGIIEHSATLLQRVLDDVLDFARGEAGRLQIVAEPFRLDEAVREVAHAADIQCRAQGLTFALIADETAERTVLGDRVRLEQLLGNLLGNALKFTPSGTVTLAVGVDDDAAGTRRFEVRDTGVGFDPEIAESLFQPFVQADSSNTRVHGGSGLGLSISRELAQAMGGEVTANGAPGAGATFTLTLPLPSAPTAETGSAVDAREPDTRERPLRVLLADDHETNRTVVRMILASIGATCVEVENGAEAVAAFERAAFDVVLMDIQMPVMDGLAAIRLMRDHERGLGRSRTPMLVVSANAMPEHVVASRRAGADGHLAKPITPARLIGALETALSAAGPESGSRHVA